MSRSVAVVGGGIAGLAAAHELSLAQQSNPALSFTLFEASPRLGGIVETHREAGFVLECGPDGWVTEKPWARELAEELGLADELIESHDAERVTYVLQQGKLVPLPRRMRMMVPESLDAIADSPLFSDAARAAFANEIARAEELKQSAPQHDESVANFVERHFGAEVLDKVGAPLLGGVFGGDVHRLSVRAVMAPFVAMEREHGSLILALQARANERAASGRRAGSIFTSLRSGTGTLAEALIARLPASSIRTGQRVASLRRSELGWTLQLQGSHEATEFDAVLLATPPDVASALLRPADTKAADLISMPASSAVIAAFGWTGENAPDVPPGFGFLAPESEGSRLLAATFSDQKFAHRAPSGGKQVRAYFGGAEADRLIPESDERIARAALDDLAAVLGPLPTPQVTVVRRWPRALPQYEVGHVERMASLTARIEDLGSLFLLGNAYRGVGLPDLIRDARSAAHTACQ